MVDTSTIQDELIIVENFVTKVWESLDPTSVPDDLKAAYTEAEQVLSALIDGGKPTTPNQSQTIAAPA